MKLLSYIFIATCIFTACAKRKIENKFYLIEPLAKATVAVSNTNYFLDLACQVAPVEIYPAFASSRIAHRSESHQIIYYNRHQWAVSPEVLITKVIEHDLKNQNLFKQVDARITMEPDYLLTTSVLQIETVAERNDLAAHLNVQFNLLNAFTNETVLEYHFDRYEVLERNDLNLFAGVINKILNQELTRLSDKMRNELSKQ